MCIYVWNCKKNFFTPFYFFFSFSLPAKFNCNSYFLFAWEMAENKFFTSFNSIIHRITFYHLSFVCVKRDFLIANEKLKLYFYWHFYNNKNTIITACSLSSPSSQSLSFPIDKSFFSVKSQEQVEEVETMKIKRRNCKTMIKVFKLYHLSHFGVMRERRKMMRR
jgi:hypothetical protein